MPLLTREEWGRFQAEGKRSFLRRRIKWGVVIGLIVGLWDAAMLALFSTWRASLPVVALSIIVGSIGAMAVAYFLFYSLLWELLRRKFSQK